MRFAVIGDYGLAGDAEARVAQLINTWGPDLIITTGDNNYPDGEAATIDANIGQYYQQYIYPYRGTYGPGQTATDFSLLWATMTGTRLALNLTWIILRCPATSAITNIPGGLFIFLR